MEVRIEVMDEGFRVYTEDKAAEAADMADPAMSEGMEDTGQIVSTVDEALDAARALLGGSPAQDEPAPTMEGEDQFLAGFGAGKTRRPVAGGDY